MTIIFVLLKKVIGSAYHWAMFRFKLDVNETIILATEQGAQKKRFLGRREERNSCFLTEEAQMEAQVLLSATITTARAVAWQWGWRECRPAARTNTDTDCTTRTHTSLFKQCWRRVEMRAQPLSQLPRDKLTYNDTHTLFTHSLLEGTAAKSCTCMEKMREDLPKPQAKCRKWKQQKKTEDC